MIENNRISINYAVNVTAIDKWQISRVDLFQFAERLNNRNFVDLTNPGHIGRVSICALLYTKDIRKASQSDLPPKLREGLFETENDLYCLLLGKVQCLSLSWKISNANYVKCMYRLQSRPHFPFNKTFMTRRTERNQ